MLLDYGVIEIGRFDDYSDAAPRAKTMRGNGITTFLLHVSQCIIFNFKKLLQQHLLLRQG